jgi:hypothetical protein
MRVKIISVLRLLVTANVVPSSPILVTLMLEVIRSSENKFLQESHGVTSWKTAFFIVTSVKISNLKYLCYKPTEKLFHVSRTKGHGVCLFFVFLLSFKSLIVKEL